jgi:glycosyltransferase involved in cell wall biosynthesis
MSDIALSERKSPTQLLAVHRLSRSKRLELAIQALSHLPVEYTLTHYGRPQDPVNDAGYAQELKTLAQSLGLGERVRFMGAVPMPELRRIYPQYQRIINMAPRTIDKTVLEAMYAGLTPIVSKTQAEAIGGLTWPVDDEPASIARYILTSPLKTRQELQSIIDERHSLRALIEKMSVYIRPGT